MAVLGIGATPVAADVVLRAEVGSRVLSTTSVDAGTGGWGWPMEPPIVVRGFVAPAGPYGPGHRGVDLGGDPGQIVRSAGDGVVAFAGLVAGIGTVSVDHGSIRTTYQPIDVAVAVGAPVDRGDVIGALGAVGGHCLPNACLHWGARRGEAYMDPLALIQPGPARLLPYWEGSSGARSLVGLRESASPDDRSAPSEPPVGRSGSPPGGSPWLAGSAPANVTPDEAGTARDGEPFDKKPPGATPVASTTIGSASTTDRTALAQLSGSSTPNRGTAAVLAVIGGLGGAALVVALLRRRG